ncbi:MAG TPA: hypothetical protein VLG47_04580 [Candidatus Saccharimonadales bacterium]|nr:hypothetical protein [Candidatus Saccharimonadales bacterium]
MQSSPKSSNAGFTTIILIIVVGVLAISAVGYWAFMNRSRNVALQGTLTASDCGSSNGCQTYNVQASDGKTYDLKVSSPPANVSSGDKVTVTGTNTAADSKHINVTSINPVGPIPTPTTAPSPTPSPSTQPIYPHNITFSSTIVSDTCSTVDKTGGPPAGDVGCGITTKNGWVIAVRIGNINPGSVHPGQIVNAPSYTESWKGKSVSVYAQAIADDNATILTNSSYYVKF